jgi:diaminopimelate epimerase
MDFTKMQGAGNDFVVVDARRMRRDWPELAIKMCDRHLGIGADSLIILLPSDRADFGMRTFDTDGSEAETCGNGIRCVARYVVEKGLAAPDVHEMTIETAAAINRVWPERNDGRVVRFRVNMGPPRLAAEEIPVTVPPGNNGDMISYPVRVNGTELILHFVSMGNPHAVHFLREPLSGFPMFEVGPVVENLPVFPHRVNFEIVRVVDSGHVEARVWERGVGETRACGSGACAITVASKLLGYTGPVLDIRLPGGVLNAEWNGSGEVVLSGPAEPVFEGRWPD